MTGKEKCRILKEIRRQIAEHNEIEWITRECSHKGECMGTCPKCEAEVRKLERELEKRRQMGKLAVVAGISAAALGAMTGCSQGTNQVMGDVPYEVQTTGKPDETEYLTGEVEEILDGEVEACPEEE